MNPLYDVVWRGYFRADKDPRSALRACAAWLGTPFPVQKIAGAS